MKNINLKSWDDTAIFCTLWDDVEKPKGVVQISHGMCEHAGRYDRFAKFLNENGFIVFADDHRAHGRTETDKQRGHHKGFIFDKTLKDLVFIHEYLKKEYNLPQFFIGHSYGSFLGQAFYEQGTDIKGMLLSGSAYLPKAYVGLGMILLSPINLLFGSWRPSFSNKATDLLFNGRYKGEKGPSLWVTGDAERRQAFIDDPYCGTYMSINFLFSMMRGIYRTVKKENWAKINTETPLALFSGDMDPIGGWGKKITDLYKRYEKSGVKKLSLHMYKNDRHEVLNEKNYTEIYKDMLDFINSNF